MTPPKSHPPTHKNEAEPDSTSSAFFEDRENSRIAFETKGGNEFETLDDKEPHKYSLLNGLEELIGEEF